MKSGQSDRRAWCSTDRPGERLSIAQPLPGVEIMSVRRSHRHWREAHEAFTLAIVRKDQSPLTATWRTRGRSLSTEVGGVMAIEPGDVHVTQRLEARDSVADFDVLRFSSALVVRAAERLELDRNFHFRSPNPTDPRAFDALGKLVTAIERGDEGFLLQCASVEALTAFMTRLGEPNDSRPALDSERDFRLRRVKEYLSTHLDERPTLDELEAVSGLCRFRLCAIFKRNYGMTLGQWWNARRLRAAVRELQRGTRMQLVVAQFGYTDEPYFSRTFKSHYGISPGLWCSMLRDNHRRPRAQEGVGRA